MTPDEIKAWAGSVDHDKMTQALEHRAANGEPRARFALAKNLEEALQAAEDHSTTETFIRTKPHAGARVGRDSTKLVALTVQESDGNVHVRGIAKSFRDQSIGHRSLELGMTRADAIELARAILKATGEDNANP